MYNILKELRIKNNLSHRDMAKILGISHVYYFQIEKGSKNLSYKMSNNIAEIFNMKPDDVFYEDIKKN